MLIPAQKYIEKKNIPGLVASYEFAGSPAARRGEICDLAYPGINSGTVYGRPAVSFDGVNDYLEVDTPFDALGGHRYAVMAGWFYFEGSNDKTIHHSRYSGGASVRVLIRLYFNDTLVVSCATAKGDSLTSEITTNTLPQDQWVSLLVLMDAEDNLSTIWVNGQLLETLAMTPAFSRDTFEADVPEDILWGIHPSMVYQYDGKMKNLAIGGFDSPPTLADAKRFHNFPQQWLAEFGFDAWYRCNEGDGGDIIDWSGNGHTMSRVGATWDTGANGGDSWVRGVDAINDATWTDPMTDTTFVVDNGSRFAADDIIRVSDSAELMQVTNVSTNTLTDTRGYLGTTAEALADNDVLLIQGDSFSPDGKYHDGDKDYTELPAAVMTILAGKPGGSFVATVSRNRIGIRETLIEGSIVSGLTKFVVEFMADNKIRVGGRDRPGTSFQSKTTTTTFATTDQLHIVGIIDIANDDVYIYVNGVLQPTTGSPSWASSNFDGTVYGKPRLWRQVGGSYPFQGSPKTAQFYPRVLSANEILALYNQGKS